MKKFFKQLFCLHCWHEYNVFQLGDFVFVHEFKCCLCDKETSGFHSIVEMTHE